MSMENGSAVAQNRKFKGLGLRDTRMVNIALLGKNAWHLFNGGGEFYVRIMQHKYLNTYNLFIEHVASS